MLNRISYNIDAEHAGSDRQYAVDAQINLHSTATLILDDHKSEWFFSKQIAARSPETLRIHRASEKHIAEKQARAYLRSLGLKLCPACGEVKPASLEFFRKGGKYDTIGLKSTCRACEYKYSIEWGKEHPEQRKATQRRYRQSHNSERKSQYAVWYYNGGDKKIKQHRKEHPEVMRTILGRRRAKLRNADGSHTAADIVLLYKGQGGRCWYCSVDLSKTGFHIDHFQPLSKNGSNNVGNLRCACPHCNHSKNDSDPHKWSGRLL